MRETTDLLQEAKVIQAWIRDVTAPKYARLQAIRAALGLSPRKRTRKRVYPTAAQVSEQQGLVGAAT